MYDDGIELPRYLQQSNLEGLHYQDIKVRELIKYNLYSLQHEKRNDWNSTPHTAP